MSDQVRETGYLKTLLELGQTLNASLDLEEVLRVAIEQVIQFVGAERGFVLLLDEDGRRIRGRATHGLDPLALDMVLSGRDPGNRPEISRTIVEQALRQRVTMLSTNAMEDPRFSSRTSVRLANVRSVLCVPLLVQSRTLGVIYLDSRVRSGVFSETQAEMLGAFANQAAVAIENARLYQNLRASMEQHIQLQKELHEKETERRALEEANRMKSEFIGLLSHELRNPLTTIRGCVQTLEQNPDDESGRALRAEFYEIIETEADRMLVLIDQLLDSSRLEANRPLMLNTRPMQVGPLLERMARAQRLHKSFTPRHRLDIDIAPDLPAVEADEDKILQIVVNLLSNAVKYSPDGGRIVLKARPTRDEGICISVSDEGIGMTAEQCTRLFHRFERIEREDIRQIKGTGLGLYLTRHLVELHGGQIECESEPGKGSVFSFYLPPRVPEAAVA